MSQMKQELVHARHTLECFDGDGDTDASLHGGRIGNGTSDEPLVHFSEAAFAKLCLYDHLVDRDLPLVDNGASGLAVDRKPIHAATPSTSGANVHWVGVAILL